MKCDLCGQVAVVAMPQHRLTLCEEHYLAWVPRTVQRNIDKYGLFTREERILLAVSGTVSLYSRVTVPTIRPAAVIAISAAL